MYTYQKFSINPANMYPTQEKTEFVQASLDYYIKLLDLCKKNNISVVLLRTPKIGWTYKNYNAMKELADKYNVAYLDYNLPELQAGIGLNAATDFYDGGHLNAQGAMKLSKHLGKYLMDNYNLKNRKNDPDYKQWNEDYSLIKDQLNRPVIKK